MQGSCRNFGKYGESKPGIEVRFVRSGSVR
jgi:hypothetical protein